MKYQDEDLKAIADGKVTISEMAKRYGVPHGTMLNALNRHGYHVRKVKITIITPYSRKTTSSIQECAEALKVSAPTIRKALRGEYVKVLEELEVKLEVVK